MAWISEVRLYSRGCYRWFYRCPVYGELKMSRLYAGESVMTSPFGPRVLEGDDRFHYGEDHVGLTSKKYNSTLLMDEWFHLRLFIIKNKNNNLGSGAITLKMDDLNGFYLFFCHLSKDLYPQDSLWIKDK